jgi:spermidine dehydrogenase
LAKQITRRDFLNGVTLSLAGAAMISPQTALAEAVKSASGRSGDYYPPVLTGIRGNHDGAFETSHALAWRGEKPSSYQDLNEEYDLVVVGAGISGLAAALFYQQKAGKDARILLLDNHDDFGGHARRNEFHSQGRMLLGPGGSGNFQDSHLYSPQSKQLISDLGFDLDKVRDAMAPGWGMASAETAVGLYTDSKHFGGDKIINGPWMGTWFGMGNYRELIQSLTVPASEQQKLIEFVEGTVALKKPLPKDNIKDFLKSTSYEEFLREYVGLAENSASLWNAIIGVTFCLGPDSISIAEAVKWGAPGFSVLGEEAYKALADTLILEESDIVWMPDGNASLTRQMVRRLIPAVAPGDTIEDLVTARFDYGKLDLQDHPVRLRLNSSAVNAHNNADGSVSVAYVTQDKAYRVKGKHCIMACYNGLIPHLCPDMPENQREGLSYGVKTPLLASIVLIRDRHAFNRAGVEVFHCPTSPYKLVSSTPPVTIGDYRPDDDPDSPVLIYMLTSPTDRNNGSQTGRDLYRQARHKLYTTSFADYEREIREQLTGMFGAFGFDADRDIEAITINRWSHGYAYDYMELYDPEWPEGEAPHELGRKRFGHISIANSDSENRAYLDGAIDAAWRAVNEQLGNG